MRTAGATRAYIELLRPANVVTAFADVLAGAAAAGAAWSRALLWLLPATACLYAGGVVLNDYFDRRLDAVERPERPIPSGRVPPGAALALGGLLLLTGIACASADSASAAVAAAIAACVLAYDWRVKHHAFLGPVNMGACRGLNLLLGTTAAAGGATGHWALALLPLTYISGVTVLSRGEVNGGKRPVALAAMLLIGATVLCAAGLAFRPAGVARLWAFSLVVVLAARVLPAYWRAWTDPAAGRIRTAVRTGVLSLALLDAVIAAGYADIMMSLAVLAVAMLASWMARLFAVT